ncbi:uncharacterized protein LOC125020252 [Mugil cephalus]|uniref:uncharacterized protein LOC125020252 n=1 Tax=Mugil cephalus TaxID=48193 RepID=UPI001FB6D23D|nr:uncharacterized protein LOC125020252 [Mugil cephalus]
MWQRCALKEDKLSRLTLPVLSSNKTMLTCRPQRQEVLKLDDEVCYSLSEDFSQIPCANRSVMSDLSSRYMEVSRWQSLISESISRVDREITAVEQVKDVTERCLQERQLYSQLMGNCVAISNSLSPALTTRQDYVFAELKKEEQLTNEVRQLLQSHICVLLDKLSSLKNTRAKLLADFDDKGEAMKLTTKCISHEVITPGSCLLPPGQYKPNHVSYDKWLSHCKGLRQAAENQLRDSSSFRANLRFTLTNLKNAQERQRRRTDGCLRKKINKLATIQNTLIWERQRVNDEISDLTKDSQKVVGQIRNCDFKLHQATHRLETLNQRPRYELCLDHPYISLALEKQDLGKMAAGLHSALNCLHHDLELKHRRLMTLEEKLSKNARALEVEQKCQKLHQSFLSALDTAVVLMNKPKLCTTTGCSSPYAYLQ